MNKKQFEQTVFITGQLPQIIANKVTFGEMTVPERREFYKLVNKTLKENNAKPLSGDYIKALLLYPEKRINNILKSRNHALGSIKEKEKKWHLYVSVLTICLNIHAKIYLPFYEESYEVLTCEASRAKKRSLQLRKVVNSYIPKTMSYVQN